MIDLLKNLDLASIQYKRDVSLEKISYFKSKGKVKLIIYPMNIENLIFINTLKINYKILGNTSNILFLDNINYGIFISMSKFKDYNLNLQDNIFECSPGLMLPKLARLFANFGIAGYEGLEGIPGTVGAAVYMNAGAYGYEISDNVIFVDILNLNNKIDRYNKEKMQFNYRKSILQKSTLGIVVRVGFDISNRDKKENLKNTIKSFQLNRNKYMEHTHPNLGSLFATHDIYKEFTKNDFLYKILLFFIRKFIYRLLKPNNNKILNYVTCKYFRINFNNQPFSDKTMNCLINVDDTKESLKYINTIKKITNNNLKLENEIYTGVEK